jgi:hypothetical protein
VDHAPEVLQGGDQRSLRADPPLPLLVAHHEVGVDVVAALHALQAGLEKTRVFLKPSPVGFLFFFGFFGFFWIFWVFLGFFGFFGFLGFFWVFLSFLGFFWFFFVFLYICPEERVFMVFSVSRILLGASRL